MSTTIHYGRPVVYSEVVQEYIVKLVRKHRNATMVRNILNAKGKNELVNLRDLKLIPNPLGISMPTILRFAHNAGLRLHRGRKETVLHRRRIAA